MTLRHAFVACLIAVAGYSASAAAAERGTAKEAQQMVERAILVYDDEGAANAFDAINTGEPPFRDRDLYVWVFEPDGLLVANAEQPENVGRNLIDLKDANDVPLVRRIVDGATPNGAWVDYLYADPLTGETLPKTSWVVLHDGYIFGCGIYKP